MLEASEYEECLARKAQEYENRCLRCGACCGVFEKDPCVKLVQDPDGRYRCSDYENRFGMQKTIKGNEFKCVTLRQILVGSWAGSWKCAYKKQLTINN